MLDCWESSTWKKTLITPWLPKFHAYFQSQSDGVSRYNYDPDTAFDNGDWDSIIAQYWDLVPYRLTSIRYLILVQSVCNKISVLGKNGGEYCPHSAEGEGKLTAAGKTFFANLGQRKWKEWRQKTPVYQKCKQNWDQKLQSVTALSPSKPKCLGNCNLCILILSSIMHPFLPVETGTNLYRDPDGWSHQDHILTSSLIWITF